MKYSGIKFSTLFTQGEALTLDCGAALAPVEIAWESWGERNAAGDNVILICHALSGDAHAADSPGQDHPGWWNGLIGPGKAIDPAQHFIICSNILGSCYGSSGPKSIHPRTGKKWGADFPAVTVRDMVRVQRAFLQELGIGQIKAILGGSLGGMQALEWAVLYPKMVHGIVPVATSARHSAWGIGFNESARRAIYNDPLWNGGNYREQPKNGLALARMIAMISYRSQPSFEEKFGHREVQTAQLQKSLIFDNGQPQFQVESYLHYQGKKFIDRFDANSYIAITRAIDAHDLSRGRSSLEAVLGGIRAKTLCIGISSDILYPAAEQKEIAEKIPGSRYREIESRHGHDAFLIEYDQLNAIVADFLHEL